MEIDETQVAESSAAESTTETSQPERVADPLKGLSEKQYDHWRSTGELPSQKQEAESSSAAETQDDGDSTSTTEESSTSPASGETEEDGKTESSPAKQTPQAAHKPTGAEARIKELDSEVKRLRARLDLADKAKTPDAEKVSTEKEPEPEAAPKMDDFEDPEEYVKAAIAHGVKEQLKAAEKERAELQQKEREQTRAKEAQDKLQKTFSDGRKKYADFDDKALDPALPIIPDSTFDHWLMDPDMTPQHRAELMYHYGTNREELLALNKMTPYNATRELTKVEAKLFTSGKSEPTTAKKNESSPATSVKKVTNAPAPGSEVGSKGSPTEDPRAKAIATGDVNAYFEIENRRELAAKGGSRK